MVLRTRSTRPPTRNGTTRLLGLLLLGLGLSSSTCRVHSCTGDDCKEEEEGGRSEVLRDRPLLLPLPGVPTAPLLLISLERRTRASTR